MIMTEEVLPEMDLETEMVEADPSLDLTATTLDTFLSISNVNAAYGAPIQTGDVILIPTAEVVSAMGFGLGYGGSEGAESAASQPASAGGSGGGGGGWAASRPVAVVVATPTGVQIKPVIDTTKLAIAALTTAGFMVSVLVRMTKRR
jgi:uncharacterized spore protein YtfJ